MKTSEQTDKIYPAIIAVQKGLEPVKREKTVKSGKFSFKYAPLDAITELLKPLFIANGLGCVQAVDETTLTTRLIHTSGQWIQSDTFLNKEQASMQAFGSEVTYKRRYALSSLIGVVPDEDTDGNLPDGQQRSGVTDGSARGGIGDDLPEDWKEFLKDLASQAQSLVRRGKVPDAFYLIDKEKLEEDQRVWMEGRMDSDVRRSIKEYSRTQTARTPV